MRFDGLTPEELVEQRLPWVQRTREKYRKFWDKNVRGENIDFTPPVADE